MKPTAKWHRNLYAIISYCTDGEFFMRRKSYWWISEKRAKNVSMCGRLLFVQKKRNKQKKSNHRNHSDAMDGTRGEEDFKYSGTKCKSVSNGDFITIYVFFWSRRTAKRQWKSLSFVFTFSLNLNVLLCLFMLQLYASFLETRKCIKLKLDKNKQCRKINHPKERNYVVVLRSEKKSDTQTRFALNFNLLSAGISMDPKLS